MATPRNGKPRGRPPGSKNLPKTLEGIVLATLATKPAIPIVPVVKRTPQRTVWTDKTPEERSAYARKIRQIGIDRGISTNPGRKKGVPSKYTAPQYALLLAQELPKAQRIMKQMASNGIIPEDAMAIESLTSALVVLRTAETNKDKLAAATLILNFTKAKPTAKIEHTIRTAEDYLDELGED